MSREKDFEYEENHSFFFDKKAYAYRPSTTAARNIRMTQRAIDLTLPQREFQEYIVQLAKSCMSEPMFTQEAFFILQEAVEYKFIRWASSALIISCLAKKRRFICKEDFVFSKNISKTML